MPSPAPLLADILKLISLLHWYTHTLCPAGEVPADGYQIPDKVSQDNCKTIAILKFALQSCALVPHIENGTVAQVHKHSVRVLTIDLKSPPLIAIRHALDDS